VSAPARRIDRTGRRLVVLAIFLTVLLIVLLIGLLLVLPQLEPQGYEEKSGIQPVRVLYGPGVGPLPLFDGPMGAAFGSDGRTYIADTGNNRIVVFDRNGRYLFEFGGLGVGKPASRVRSTWQPGLLNYPTDVATDDAGNVYVADFRNDQIQVFDANGRFKRVFPDRTRRVGKGASGQDGTGIAVTSLCVKAGRLYATDKYQIFEFDVQGNLIRQFGKPGDGEGDLDHPNGITIGLNSTLMVSDSNHNRVLAYESDGTLLWTVGRPLGLGLHSAGDLEVPRGLTSIDGGDIFVVDAMASRIIRLSSDGAVVSRFGARGSAPGELNFPTDVDWMDGLFVIAEKGNDRVQIVKIDSE